MKHLLRPYVKFHLNLVLAVAFVCLIAAPRGARAQAQAIIPFLEDPNPLLAHAGTAGYLGVEVADVDADKAQTLKLKEVRGAVITLIDHDAPAGQIGLKVNDVVLAINGQNVEGAEALRRMLREIPPGRKISLEISRDGNIQTLAAQLVDRKEMEHDVWNKILNVEPGPIAPAPPSGMGVLAGADAPPPSGWHMSLFTSTLNVGALVEPLTSQMAEYLDVAGGLMVKQVGHKSEAAAAGLKAFDVILKVGADPIATVADWDRALRSNQGKPVQVTILRDKKQQNLTLQVDSKHHSEVEFEDLFPNGDPSLMAGVAPEIDADLAQTLAAQAQAQADAAAGQADAMKHAIDGLQFEISPEQMKQFHQQMEEFQKNFGPGTSKIDPQQMEQLQKQMEELKKNFNPEAFTFDSKQMEQLRQQMEEFKKNFNDDRMKQLQQQLRQQMEQFNRQMEECQQDSGHFV